MKWFVSRQDYSSCGADEENRWYVEIAEGGIDYANPGMLVTVYRGEGEEYTDPREAVKAAIEIAEAWQINDETAARHHGRAPKRINIAHGSTGGMTMPMITGDGIHDEGVQEELLRWADETWEKLEKCPTCGEIMEGAEDWYLAGSWRGDEFLPNNDGDKYCSEHCAEKASTWECSNCMCDVFYYYSDRNNLEEVRGEYLCPDCRKALCAICGVPNEDHDDEIHDFEYEEV